MAKTSIKESVIICLECFAIIFVFCIIALAFYLSITTVMHRDYKECFTPGIAEASLDESIEVNCLYK